MSFAYNSFMKSMFNRIAKICPNKIIELSKLSWIFTKIWIHRTHLSIKNKTKNSVRLNVLWLHFILVKTEVIKCLRNTNLFLLYDNVKLQLFLFIKALYFFFQHECSYLKFIKISWNTSCHNLNCQKIFICVGFSISGLSTLY